MIVHHATDAPGLSLRYALHMGFENHISSQDVRSPISAMKCMRAMPPIAATSSIIPSYVLREEAIAYVNFEKMESRLLSRYSQLDAAM